MANILITGANRGLGLEFARQYCADGWQVIATCRNPDQADQLAELGVEILPLDLSDFSACARLADRLRGRSIDILLNNAGMLDDAKKFGDIDQSAWLELMRVNAMAPILLTEALLPNLVAGDQRRVAFLSSVMGSIGQNSGGGYYAYRSSKAALNAAVQSLSIDLAGQGISTLLLHPGWAKTAMGGAHATVETPDSVSGMRHLIGQMQSGQPLRFLDYRGRPLAW
jgi:NAD(P)-dependent dehydrogenase (short-subunit alcohol dehydrogenase family)